MSQGEKLLLRVEEARAKCNLGRNLFYNLVAQGVIPSVKVSERCLRIPAKALEQWIESQTRRVG